MLDFSTKFNKYYNKAGQRFIDILQSRASVIKKWGNFLCYLQSWVSDNKVDMYYKFRQFRLQSGASITM